jgi:hypothetical protein
MCYHFICNYSSFQETIIFYCNKLFLLVQKPGKKIHSYCYRTDNYVLEWLQYKILEPLKYKSTCIHFPEWLKYNFFGCGFPKFVTSGSGLGSGFSKIQVWVRVQGSIFFLKNRVLGSGLGWVL